jgi:hypothetical protein
VPHLNKLQKELGWGWRPYCFCTAKRLSYNIASFEASFEFPADQQVDDAAERIYRMKQLSQNIEGMILADKHHPNGK